MLWSRIYSELMSYCWGEPFSQHLTGNIVTIPQRHLTSLSPTQCMHSLDRCTSANRLPMMQCSKWCNAANGKYCKSLNEYIKINITQCKSAMKRMMMTVAVTFQFYFQAQRANYMFNKQKKRLSWCDLDLNQVIFVRLRLIFFCDVTGKRFQFHQTHGS